MIIRKYQYLFNRWEFMMDNLSNKRVIACCLFPAILLLSACKSTIPKKIDLTACPIDQRSARALGQSTAKLVQASFHAYQQRDIGEAINFLLSIQAKNTFDRAYVDRMLGNFYAEQGQMDKALEYLALAINADVLGGSDHAGTLRLYADLLLSQNDFINAIDYYQEWMRFRCKDSGLAYMLISKAYLSLNDWDNLYLYLTKAIAASDSSLKLNYQTQLNDAYHQVKYDDIRKLFIELNQVLYQKKSNWRNIKDEKKSTSEETEISVSRNSLVPIVRIAPRYPIAAARAGIEGWVTMSFTINEQGRPSNIKVIDSVPEGVFNEQAVLALSKWLYKPVIVDDMKVKLEFKLD